MNQDIGSLEQPDKFKAWNNAILKYGDIRERLLHRPEWGTEIFEVLRPGMNRLFRSSTLLAALPVEDIQHHILEEMSGALEYLALVLQRIDGLSTAADMVQQREEIVAEFQAHEEAFTGHCRSELPLLAISAGDADRWSSTAHSEQQKIEKYVQESQRLTDEIVAAHQIAQETAGGEGAAQFTKEFKEQAEASGEAADRWLRFTVRTFGAALGTAILFVALGLGTKPESLVDAAIQLGWRLSVFGILAGGAAWCGRQYRAHLHNQTVNKHRAACLENMRAFQHAATDTAIKDLVILEFSRAAAQGMPTGFITGEADGRSGAGTSSLLPMTTKAPQE